MSWIITKDQVSPPSALLAMLQSLMASQMLAVFLTFCLQALLITKLNGAMVMFR
jgi:hypothetical protein